MFSPTANEYKFKYLITGLTGPGIECVYLPEIPSPDKIRFKKERKFVRDVMPENLVKAEKLVQKERSKKNSKGEYVHLDWVHPVLQAEINAWEDEQWKFCREGYFFYNEYSDDPTKGPEITYLTAFHVWYLNHWKPYFGSPDFRDPDKEVFYWIQFFEEDPDSFGGAFNAIRRWAKSTILGAWLVYRTTMNYNHNTGMQGETDDKIKKFYKKSVLKPFYKLPNFLKPAFNTDTKQTNSIEFDLPPQRGMRNSLDDVESLESMIDYRPSGEGEYDGDILNSYAMEEPGKVKKVSIYNDEGEGRWDIVKPCFLQGEEICGKAILPTTVENMNMADKGGKAWRKLVYDSDYNQKQADGRTISGLYFAFLPGDVAYKGFYDANGRPKRAEARASLLRTRDSYRGNARKLAGWIRKYPLSIVEIFYVSPDHCEFNSEVLQDRLREIHTSPEPMTSKGDFYWDNNVRFGNVKWRHNPHSGFADVSWLPSNETDSNKVGKKLEHGEWQYFPENDGNFASGVDPIQHGTNGTTRESKPVQYVKSKYDSTIDGVVSQVDLEERAKIKYPYKTNKYLLRMAVRPSNPNVLFERTLMICWFFGVSIHVEKQFGGALINYFHEAGCGDFILHKYKPEFEKPDKLPTDGSSANTNFIQEYTGAYAVYVDYFGHTIPFQEQIEDNLIYDASNTTEHDDTVACGLTEMACKIRPKNTPKKPVNLMDYMTMFDPYTQEVIN